MWSEINLYQLCIEQMIKTNVLEKYVDCLDILPITIKSTLFSIYSKRGLITDVAIFKALVNPYIWEVDLSECMVTDHYLYCLQSCKSLKVLDLSLRRRQNRCISNAALVALFPKLPELRVISIPHCRQVNDKVIDVVTKYCKSLLELHVPNSNITDRSMRLIGINLKNLTVLNILGTRVTDNGIHNLLRGELRLWLREINIDKCPFITIRSGRMVDRHCPNIKIFTCGCLSDLEESGRIMNRIRAKAQQVFWSV